MSEDYQRIAVTIGTGCRRSWSTDYRFIRDVLDTNQLSWVTAMAYENSSYDPHWREKYIFARTTYEAARQEMTRLVDNGQTRTRAYEQAKSVARKYLIICQGASKAQFETVQEYAESIFRVFAEKNGLHDIDSIFPDINFEGFRTIAEFDAIWSRVCRHLKVTDVQKQHQLPIGQPKGMLAFANAVSPNLNRERRQFMAPEFFPGDYVGDAGIWAIITTDVLADGQYICLTRRWGRPGISVVNALEMFATGIYRDAQDKAVQTSPEYILQSFLRKLFLGGNRRRLDPNRLSFYEHVPPDPHGNFRESFASVTMSFESGSFKGPRWHYYSEIPEVIQSSWLRLALIQAVAVTEVSPKFI